LILLAAALAGALADGFLLGSPAPVKLAITGTEGTANLALRSPVAAPFIRRGTTPLVTVHAADGAEIACVAAASDAIGTVSGVNLGVAVKSVAVLLDAQWRPVADAQAAWVALARAGTRFENWENCGAKLEGPPSPASVLVPDAAGAQDDIADGNPGTTYNLVPRRYDSATIAAMLGPDGYVADGVTTRLMIFADGARRLLVMQGIAPGPRGFLALYLER
jgi:hypothetical protein